MTNQLRIVFCLPGNSFSGHFLDCWSKTLFYCSNNSILPYISRKESCNIYYVRNMCLGADVTRGEYQLPFDGKIDYDYLMWIDSDIIFDPHQISVLLKNDKDIVSGLYLTASGKEFAVVKDWDEEFFKNNGCFHFLTPAEIENHNNLIEVSYTGFGFILIKRGVFEKMEYPWFRAIEQRIGNMVDFTMEDVSFCLRAKALGYKIFVDPKVKVLHAKSVLL